MGLREKKLGLIGAGNMGSAILEGLLSRRLMTPASISVFDKMTEKADELARRLGVDPASSNAELVQKCDLILLAIKPQDLATVSAELRGVLSTRHTVLSILAGMTLAKLAEFLGRQAVLVRAMPNLGARVGASLTALDGTQAEAIALAEEVFSGCGKTLRLEEKHFDDFTALAGSGPAYFFLLMESIEKKALEKGFNADAARLTALQTALGAALTALSGTESPADLRKMVTSKGGTTEAALETLEKNKVRDVFSAAYDAAADRGRALRGG